MTDALDDLFGAFDEADQGHSQTEPPPKRKRLDTEAEDQRREAVPASKGSVGDANGTAAGKDTGNYFERIMSVQSKVETSKKPVTGAKPPATSGKANSGTVIATGTADDKSVRGYTAQAPVGSTNTLPPDPDLTPAKTYGFQLDPFQQQAVSYIRKNESVLVAAHTSAGKTAVAEYAIAQALRCQERVIYTSPIKALSNQKFRDLSQEFETGLMTGDTTINPEAPVLVMTTEILRSMLYRGSPVLKAVSWVIYDEVHYMRDASRGVVWEESIVLLPDVVRFVFLSATIPNASQFADWIAATHNQKCHVVYTNYRPVPLQHYIFPAGADGLHLVVDEKGSFRHDNFAKAMASMSSMEQPETSSSKDKKKSLSKQRASRGSDLNRIVNLLLTRDLSPVIVFSFSKKDCERYALALNDMDGTEQIEKDLISQVYKNAIVSLSEDDQKLPQVQALLPLLQRGIGIHHGGLLPILKEIVEILFTEGLLRVLFATETFAIGINAPAKCVVFTNARKWDGKEFRFVSCGEYIQMSGRAGRRGKDDRGMVIQMVDEQMEPDTLRSILYGESDALHSSYRISYHMLLNLMRVQDVDPEFLLQASFFQFQRELEAPALAERAKSLEEEAEGIVVEQSELVAPYYEMVSQLGFLRSKITEIIQRPENSVRYVQNQGRLVQVSIEGEDFGWGLIVSCKAPTSAMKHAKDYVVEALLLCVDRHFDREQKGRDEDEENINVPWQGKLSTCRPVRGDDDGRFATMRLFTVGLKNIMKISPVRLSKISTDWRAPASRKKNASKLQGIKQKLNGIIPLLDPIKDMRIKDDKLKTYLERAELLAARISEHELDKVEGKDAMVETYSSKVDLQRQAKLYREEARQFQSLAKREELQKMKRVLKNLGHVDSKGVIQTKGRTACEINTANELVVVELIFAGVFTDLTPEVCVALMSCMTFDEPLSDEGDVTSGLKSHLSSPFYRLQEIARKVLGVTSKCGIEMDEEEFMQSFNPGM